MIAAQGLSVGGYGEIAMSRNFYSDNVYRYSNPTKYKDDPSHGRFDIPHAVIYLGYDFGQGWTMQTEIEFEHTGAEDRLHDNRARNVIEAIMWHGYSKESDAYWCTEKFYNLPKEERDAVVEFINSI